MNHGIPSSVVVSVEPTLEPVTIEEAMLHLRVTDDSETTYIETLITAARRWVEDFTARTTVNTTLVKRYDAVVFPLWLQLERPPLVSVTSVAYVDANGDSQTVATSVYTVDSSSQPGRIVLAFGKTWPAVRDVIQSITVTYVAGYGATAASVPAHFRQAMLLLIGNWFENREATISGTIIATVPMTVESILWPHRMLSI